MLSVIIPVYNEADNVEPLYRELTAELNSLGQAHEIIFVNDGSTDATLSKLKSLKGIKIINLRRRSGQSIAFDVGLKASKGDLIVTMDGDGQNDPHDIGHMLEVLNEGNDVVCGWRSPRRDPWLSLFVARFARAMRKTLLGDQMHDSGCSLRVYKREAIINLDLYGEMHRMITALLTLRGYKLAEVKVNHRARTKGKSKYNFTKTIRGFVDIINLWLSARFDGRPLHLLGGVGLISMVIGTIIAVYFFVLRIFFEVPLMGRVMPFLGLYLILFGVQIFAIGFLADLLTRNNRSTHSADLIKEVIEN